MNKKKWLRIVSIYSVIYTAITLLSSVFYLCNGVYEDPSGNWHELDRAIILLIGIAAFELCTNLPVKPLALRYLIAYIPSQLLAFAYVWFSGLREPLAKTAYRDIWINFTGLFVLLCIINTVHLYFKKKERAERGKVMSKYDALWEYVQKSEKESFQLTFEEIQEIAGIPIDHSFLKYKKELAEYGWQVGKISMKEQTVSFHKVD